MMTRKESIALQLQFNFLFGAIMDGRVDELIAQLSKDTTPELQIEIKFLREIYEKILTAKPLIEKLHKRGRIIKNATKN